MTNCTFSISAFEQVKAKVLNYAKQFDTFCFLDNHQYQLAPHSIECILAAGIKRSLSASAGQALSQLQSFIDEKPSWLFGHLGYDLKNETEKLVSANPDEVGFADLFFFEPQVLIQLTEDKISIRGDDPEEIYRSISSEKDFISHKPVSVEIQGRFDRSSYLSVLEKLKHHIQRGDCYEINFCQEFYSTDCAIDPLDVYWKLTQVSPNPFSGLYRVKDRWLVCASPERYLKKAGSGIISQPIKGTLKRDLQNEQRGIDALYQSEKDRSENVMVVDLVRNDLSRICEDDSVKVDELFGIYTFPQVYQMISTVSGKLRKDISFTDIIRATFPMGSMTGAPKRRVMELVEQYENRKRGIFSGALGYISPSGDFDFNVVIRSIMYNAETDYLSFQAGSGITFYSDAEKEWEECLLKVEAIKSVLTL